MSALDILADISLRRHRQRMAVMEAVWPINAVCPGPLAPVAHPQVGAAPQPALAAGARPGGAPEVALPVSVPPGVGHCGAGCTLDDIVAETANLGWSDLGSTLLAEYAGDCAVALLVDIVLQHLALAPMRGLGLRKGLLVAASLVFFPEPHPQPDSPVYCRLMQIGMALGFCTAWPVNVWRIRRGIQEEM